MFKSNDDKVTRDEARGYVEGIDARISDLQSRGQRELADLSRRVTALEELAESLKGQRSGMTLGTPRPAFQQADGALTRRDAEAALNRLQDAAQDEIEALRRDGAAEFSKLAAKIDEGTRRVVAYCSDVPEQYTQAATALDYGAVAFGLSEMKRKIVDAFGYSGEVGREHSGAVQYFADVFAKADPAFDADEFKRAAGA